MNFTRADLVVSTFSSDLQLHVVACKNMTGGAAMMHYEGDRVSRGG
jgi:hypothetical protein